MVEEVVERFNVGIGEPLEPLDIFDMRQVASTVRRTGRILGSRLGLFGTDGHGGCCCGRHRHGDNRTKKNERTLDGCVWSLVSRKGEG